MNEIIDANNGPFFVNVGQTSDGHVERLRYPPGFPLKTKMQLPKRSSASLFSRRLDQQINCRERMAA